MKNTDESNAYRVTKLIFIKYNNIIMKNQHKNNLNKN